MVEIEVFLNYEVPSPMDILLQIEAADGYGQNVLESLLEFNSQTEISKIGGEEHIGQRIWFNKVGDMTIRYTAKVDIVREPTDLATLSALPTRMLDSEATRYLMPSTYCAAFDFVTVVENEFNGLKGGNLVAEMANWIKSNINYVSGSSSPTTTASDTFVLRQGVCRDFTHVLISMCRAVGIPARFVSVYAPNVDPPDFHAVAEVYLDGNWFLVDATGMAQPNDIAVIGVGSDAADVSFMTSFGMVNFIAQRVQVKQTA